MQISSDTTYLFRIYIFLGTSQRSKGCSKINWQSKASTKTKIWSKYARENATFIIKNAKINQKVWHFKELQSVLIFPRWKSQVKKGKGQLISKCPYEKSVLSKIPTKKLISLGLWFITIISNLRSFSVDLSKQLAEVDKSRSVFSL